MRKVPSPATPRLRELREQRGLKRANLAVEFDVDTTTIIRWEQVGPPRDVIPRLAEFFGVTGDYLMNWDGERAA